MDNWDKSVEIFKLLMMAYYVWFSQMLIRKMEKKELEKRWIDDY